MYAANYVHRHTLLEMLQEIIPSDSSRPCLIMGDSNINLLSSIRSEEYSRVLGTQGFSQTITGVTRPGADTCLDHIAVRGCERYLEIQPAIWASRVFSDHYPVLINLSGTETRASAHAQPLPAQMRLHSKSSIELFLSRLEGHDWNQVTVENDVDRAFKNFADTVSHIYEESCPLVGRSVVVGSHSGFCFSPGLRRLRTNVQKLYRWWRKTRTDEAKANYYNSLSRFRRAIHLAKTSYYKNEFLRQKGNPARLWSFINRSCGRDSKRAELPTVFKTPSGYIDKPEAIASFLNSHFESIGPKTVEPLRIFEDIVPELRRLRPPRPTSPSFVPVGALEIQNALAHMRVGWRCGAVGVPDRLLALASVYISKPLATIFNRSLSSGVFFQPAEEDNGCSTLQEEGRAI